MRAVVQRVVSASVSVLASGRVTYRAEIATGLVILVGVRADDTDLDASYIGSKIAGLRIFEDTLGKINLSLQETGGSVLMVSNFTLYGDCRKGRRPSFTEAAAGPVAERLYRHCGIVLEQAGIETKYGVFGAEMQVALVNDGPLTMLLDSRKQF